MTVNAGKTKALNHESGAVLHRQHSLERGQWSSKCEFLLSCISMCIGLGNVWRFPYVAYENGGGAFLIPYLLLLFVVGRPIYYFELIVGQFSGQGSVKMWKCVPALKGVGYAQLFSVSYVVIFYNYLMGIFLYYLYASFSASSDRLPWTTCDDRWTAAGFCAANPNATTYQNQTWPELYYKRNVLNVSQGLWDLNTINRPMLCCLIASWTLVYVSIVKGVTSMGKVAYFTALFPLAVLTALLIVSLQQPGAIDGIVFFVTPNFAKLLDPIVWYRAVEQSFFSLAICFGSIVMYGSYNRFDHNIYRDCIIISILDTFASMLAGFVTFAVLGAMAHDGNARIQDVVRGGPGLAFIVYPEGLSKIALYPQLWSALFFVMLFTLGIGSSVAMIETILTCVRDRFTALQRHKAATAFVFCVLYLLLGVPLTTDAGIYIMQLLDNYGVGTAAFLYGILELIGLIWIYGIRNFAADAQFMLGFSLSRVSKFIWAFVTPIILISIFVYRNILLFTESGSDVSAQIPRWGFAIGWCLAAVALSQIPIWFAIEIYRQKSLSFRNKLLLAFSPAADYGPRDEKIFNQWLQWKLDNANSDDNDNSSENDENNSSNDSRNNIYISTSDLESKQFIID